MRDPSPISRNYLARKLKRLAILPLPPTQPLNSSRNPLTPSRRFAENSRSDSTTPNDHYSALLSNKSTFRLSTRVSLPLPRSRTILVVHTQIRSSYDTAYPSFSPHRIRIKLNDESAFLNGVRAIARTYYVNSRSKSLHGHAGIRRPHPASALRGEGAWLSASKLSSPLIKRGK